MAEIAIMFTDTPEGVTIEMLIKESLPEDPDDLTEAQRQAVQTMRILEQIGGREIRQLDLVPIVEASDKPIIPIKEVVSRDC